MKTQKTQNDVLNFGSCPADRLDFVDVWKGIGILLVVIAHVNYSQPLLTIIYSFHMPLFFVMSGMLFKPQSYENFVSFIKKKSRSLLCPYVLFYLLSILYHIVVQFVADYNCMNWNLYLKYFFQMFLSQGSANVANAPLWFVPCLMLVETIYYFVSKANRYITVTASALITVLGWLLESDILNFDNKLLPWSLDSAMFAVGFFAFGQLLSGPILKFATSINSDRFSLVKHIVIILVCAVLLIPLALLNGKVSMGSKELNNGFLFYATGLIGSALVLSAGLLLKKSKFLAYCGKNSFYIMSTHYLAREAIRMLYKFADIPIYDKTSLTETIIPIIIVLCLSLSFVFVYNIIKSKAIAKFGVS